MKICKISLVLCVVIAIVAVHMYGFALQPSEDIVGNSPTPDNHRVKVVCYDASMSYYCFGSMNIIDHSPIGYDNLRYKVLDETSFELDEDYNIYGRDDDFNPIYGSMRFSDAIAKATRIALVTNDVFVEREGKVDYTHFGRVDSNGYDTSLTIAPYVVPKLGDDIDKMWLAYCTYSGRVWAVFMVVE